MTRTTRTEAGAVDRLRATVRVATEGDLENIHRSLIDLARHVNEEHKMRSSVVDLRRHMFGDDPAVEGVVAEIAGEYAGMSLFFPSYSTWHGRTGVYVQDIFVEPRFRGAGVGDRLLQHVAALTRAKGGAYMRLAVDTENRAAMRFYTRLGLEHSDTEQIHAAYGENFAALADAGDRLVEVT
jgi:ribosomal protein S18 acetylase RimI-like enzyme